MTDHQADFRRRVNRASSHISRGTPSTRAFDNCFEMHDGDYVVTALVRRSAANPTGPLARNLFTYIGEKRALEVARALQNIPTDQLPRHAEACILKAHREFDEWMEAQRQKRA